MRRTSRLVVCCIWLQFGISIEFKTYVRMVSKYNVLQESCDIAFTFSRRLICSSEKIPLSCREC